MSARIVVVENPCSEQDADDPAVLVTCLLRLAQVDAVIGVAEDAGCGVEVHAWHRGDFDREPDSVEQEPGEEDCDVEGEVVLQESQVPDIGDQGEEHANCGEDRGEPAFVSRKVASGYWIC